MHRIDTPGAVPPGLFAAPNPLTGQQAVVVSSDWLNDLQENIMEVLAAAGVPAVPGDANNLRDSILGLISGAVAGVTFFNTRSGNVTLTDADVIGALNPGAIVNALLAPMAADTVKLNNTGAPDSPTDLGFAAFVTLLLGYGGVSVTGFSLAQNGWIRFRVYDGSAYHTLCLQWGYNNVSFTGEGARAVAFPTAFTTACWGALATVIGDGTSGNDVWTQISTFGGVTAAGMSIYYQAPNSGITNHGAFWFALGD